MKPWKIDKDKRYECLNHSSILWTIVDDIKSIVSWATRKFSVEKWASKAPWRMNQDWWLMLAAVSISKDFSCRSLQHCIQCLKSNTGTRKSDDEPNFCKSCNMRQEHHQWSTKSWKYPINNYGWCQGQCVMTEDEKFLLRNEHEKHHGIRIKFDYSYAMGYQGLCGAKR